MFRLAIPAVLLLTAGATTAATPQDGRQTRADRALARALDGRVAGETTDCITASGTDGPQVIDRNTLLYRQGGRTVWRNELPVNCPALGPGNTIIIELHGGQICKNDTFRVLEPGANIPSGSCRLGEFTPYRKP